jgi:predicted ATPase
LLRRWSRAKTGEGQVVLLSGEPGIGKSRLTAAMLGTVADEPHTHLRYFCSPQHTDSAFGLASDLHVVKKILPMLVKLHRVQYAVSAVLLARL